MCRKILGKGCKFNRIEQWIKGKKCIDFYFSLEVDPLTMTSLALFAFAMTPFAEISFVTVPETSKQNNKIITYDLQIKKNNGKYIRIISSAAVHAS